MKLCRYLSETKPLLVKLIKKLNEEYEYASVLATDSKGKRYTVSKSNVNINSAMFIERGCVVRVYCSNSYFEYAFNNINEGNFDDIVNSVRSAAKFTKVLKDAESLRNYELLNEEKMQFSKCAEVEKDPKDVGDNNIIADMTKIKDEALSLSDKVVNVGINFQYVNVNKVFLSPNKDLEQSFMWSESSIFCVTGDKNGNKQLYKGFSGLKGAELLDEMKDCAKEVVDEGVKLLDAKRIAPGEYDVICTPDITGLIAHEAFGHGVEMDMYVKDRAKSKYYIGKPVASDIVTMIDGAAAAENNGSFFFDDEGTEAGETVIIENGILKSGMSDSLTSLELKKKPTGNGRRQAYDRKAYTRMTNTFIKPGTDKLEDMISSIKYGVMLDMTFSGMEDPKNWGIQCMMNIGREIKDGKLTGKIFSPVIMTGYVPDLLKSITMISDDFKLAGGGYCGKGYKEFVKVSDGGPYIKCRARLG